MHKHAISYIWFQVIFALCFAIVDAEDSQPGEMDVSTSCPFVYQSVNVITGDYCENQTDLRFGGPHPLDLRRSYSSSDPIAQGWHFNHPNIPAFMLNFEEGLPDLALQYYFDENGRLKEIQSGNKDVIYHTLNVTYEDRADGLIGCKVQAEDGQTAQYTFKKLESSRAAHPYLLQEVSTSSGKSIHYHYQDHPRERKKLISKREEADGRYLITEYYDSFINNVGDTIVRISDLNRDPRLGKTKLLKAPVGIDNTPIITTRFFYHEGYTEVFDALNHKTLYHFGKNQKLTAVESFSEDGNLYRVERHFWNEKDQLISKSIEDSQKKVYGCQTFKYDAKGNLIRHTLYGNLTGSSKADISLDEKGQPSENGIESYTTFYRYSEDEKHLLLFQTADNGVSERYFYQNDSAKLLYKLTYDHDFLRIRQFYEYDPQGNLIATIVDDGQSEAPENLMQVSERKITRFFPKQENPGRGLPEIIEEKYLDLSSEVEILLKRTLLSYSERGDVISQSIYDSSGSFQQSFIFTYDSFGRLLSKIDSEGNETSFAYDENGNQVRCNEKDHEIISAFDYSNRLIRRELKKEQAPLEITNFKYDFAGNKIASIDLFGNETNFEFDVLGRLTKIINPAVTNSKNESIRPTTTLSYDILDRVISAMDANGYITKTNYNARGKPIKVVHADGSIERFEYNLDGTLSKTTCRTGNYIIYKRDFLARAISEEHFSEYGELIKSIIRDYSAFHLMSEADHSGKITYYHYDGAGRQHQIIQMSTSSHKKTEIAYDTMSQPISRKEFYGKNHNECIIACGEKDSNQKIVAYSIQNSSGEVLKRKELKSPDKKENNPEFTYNYDYFNSRGQNVLQSLYKDSSGNTVITTYDALRRPVQIEKKNLMNDTIALKELFYDWVGNKLKEVHHNLSGRKPYICSWTYGPENRLESSTEGEGSEIPRTTYYSYCANGKIECIVKPDGTSLYYEYNSTGKQKRLYSSDGTVDYSFTYDFFERLIQVEDHVHHNITSRQYNDDNLMINEILGNALSITSAHDLCGRRTELTLSDNSKVLYTYDAAYLRSINRISPAGISLYQHHYKSYSLTGKVVEESLIGNLCTLKRSYDENDLLKSIETPYWNQYLERSVSKQIQSVISEDPAGTSYACYQYDSLGQLTNESQNEEIHYIYDSLHNRIQIGEQDVVFDDLGQLISQNNQHFRYDNNGNLVNIQNPSDQTSFAYDALNRLINVTKDHAFTISYIYDSFNRRISSIKREWDSSLSQWTTSTKHFLYDGMNEIGSADEHGMINELRVLGVGLVAEIGATIDIEIENEIYAPIHDHRGSICCLVSLTTGLSMEWYRYSAFGCEDCQSLLKIETGNPWRFSGKRVDEETGLIFFGQRYYQPESGRWLTKDPLGTPESINRYAYNQNDPLNRIDAHGLLSFSEVINTFWDYIQSAYVFINRSLNTFENNFFFSDFLRPAAEKIGQAFLGYGFLLLSGFYNDVSETGIHGKGEISDKVRVTLINGILNARSDYKQTLDILSDTHGGTNIHYIFDATDGWCWDMLKCLLVKCGYISPQAHMIADTWRKLIDEMGGAGGGGVIYHYAHSIGAAHTNAALSLLTPEEKQMIKIFTLGSPSIIDDGMLNGVCNYVSVRDGVCLLDPIGFFSGILGLNDKVVPVGDWLGIPFVDHTLNSGTYLEIIKMLGQQFLNLYISGQGF